MLQLGGFRLSSGKALYTSLSFSMLPLPQNQSSDNDNTIPIFYNLYIASPDDIPRVADLMMEQFQYLTEKHDPMYVYSYGNGTRHWENVTQSMATAASKNNQTTTTPNNIVHVRHLDSGGESETLYELWNYCQHNVEKQVVYLHSKGSFHDTLENQYLRRFNTMGTLHKDCTTATKECNLCGARFSPLPHPHFAGNMWHANCSYISQLYNPLEFEEAMEKVTTWGKRAPGWSVGRGRHAYEHWVGSHPAAKPCDTYSKPDYVWGYGITNFTAQDFQVAPVARFPLQSYNPNPFWWRGSSVEFRQKEYQALYNASVDDHQDWWGWQFFENNKTEAAATNATTTVS